MQTLNFKTALCAAFCSLIILPAGFMATAQAALISVDGEILYIEPTPACEPIIVRATLLNAGATALELNTPEPSCGCTRAETSASTLQPGETTELYLEIDIPNKPGSELNESVTVSTKDGSSIMLPIQGVFEPCALLNEKFISMGDVSVDSASELIKSVPIELFAATPDDISFETSTDELSISVNETGEGSSLQISVKPTNQLGTRNEKATMYIGGNKFEEINLSWRSTSARFEKVKIPIPFARVKLGEEKTVATTILAAEGYEIKNVSVLNSGEFSLLAHDLKSGELTLALTPRAKGSIKGLLKVVVSEIATEEEASYLLPMSAFSVE